MIFNKCVYVDGSLMANYPINYLDDLDDTIGFFIRDDGSYYEIETLDTYMIHILKCMSKQDGNNMVTNYGEHTIIINTTSNLFEFGLSNEYKQDIFDKGYISTNDYLSKYYHPRIPIQLMNEINKKTQQHEDNKI
jgi:hypothetical protein